MARDSGFLPIAVLAILAGGVLYLPSGTGRPPAAQPAVTTRPGDGAEGAAARDEQRRRVEETHKDAFALIAEFLGKPLALEPIWAAGAVNADARTALRLADRWPSLARAGEVRRLVRNRYAVEFLVATVPDGIDSNTRWLFDASLDAVQRAIHASGYELDRFYIPDWAPEIGVDGVRRSPSRLHEQLPGVLLFRDRAQAKLLVLFLIFETPTGGIHQDAFRQATWTIAAWNSVGASDPRGPADVRIVGPTFSGSVPSIVTAIENSREVPAAGADVATMLDAFGLRDQLRVVQSVPPGRTDLSPLRFRMVTGSASNPDIGGVLRKAGVDFKATTLDDGIVTQEAVTWLKSHLGIRRVVALYEGNTRYGSGFRKALAGVDVREIPFPLHISRLRRAVPSQQSPDSKPGAGRAYIPVILDDPVVPTDQVPALSPRSTASVVDVSIASILDTISRERIDAVFLLATDTRDKLFLAQQIRSVNRNVPLVTTEGDLLYVHPDYRRYVEGMLVAASYPIFMSTQFWSNRPAQNQAFVSGIAQGAYNATLALLNHDATGRASASAPPLLDYTDQDGKPALHVWIGVVGRGGIWPLDRIVQRTGSMFVPGGTGAADGPVASAVHASRWMWVLVLVLDICAAAHLLLWWRRRHLPDDARRDQQSGLSSWLARVFDTAGYVNRKKYVAAGYLSLMLALVVVQAPVWLSVLAMPQGIADSPLTALGGLASAGMSVMLGVACCDLLFNAAARSAGRWVDTTAGSASPSAPGAADTQRTVRRLVDVFGLATAAAIAGGLFLYGVGLMRQVSTDAFAAIAYAERALHPSNGVSPVMPMLILAAGVYLWSVSNLKRLTLPTVTDAPPGLDAYAMGGLDGQLRRLRGAIRNPVASLPVEHVAVLGAAIGAAIIAMWWQNLRTTEPTPYDLAYAAGWLLLQFLIGVTILHTRHLARQLKVMLKGIAIHPMSDAYARLPRELFANRYPAHAARLVHLGHARQLRTALVAMLRMPAAAASAAPAPVGAPGGHATADIRQQLDQAIADPLPSPDIIEFDEPDRFDEELHAGRTCAASTTWAQHLQVCARLSPLLQEHWRSRQDAEVSMPAEGDKGKATRTDRWFRHAEEFVAIHVAVILREILVRLVSGMVFAVAGMLLLSAYPAVFPVAPAQMLLGFGWMYIMATVGLVVVITLEIERDSVLSRLAGTPPGRLTWDSALITRLVLYAIIPLITVFATQFPEVGETLLQWLKPVQTALP